MVQRSNPLPPPRHGRGSAIVLSPSPPVVWGGCGTVPLPPPVVLGMYGVYGRSGMACLECMVCLVCMVGMVCMAWMVGIVWMVDVVCKSVGYGMVDYSMYGMYGYYDGYGMFAM